MNPHSLQDIADLNARAIIERCAVTVRSGTKSGANRNFVTASFSYDGDPAYLSVANPPKRGPVFARAVSDGQLGEITKTINAFFKGYNSGGAILELSGKDVRTAVDAITHYGVHKSLANVAALTLAGLLTLEQAKQLFASYKNLHLIRFVYDKSDGQWEIADDGLLASRKPYKPRGPKGQGVCPTTVTVEADDDDDILFLAANT